MKSLREQFEMDYAPVPYVIGGKVKIKYVYDAPWYFWDLPKETLKKKKWQLTCVSIAVLVLFVASALIPSGVNTWTVTAIAGTFGLAVHVLELFGLLRFLAAKERTTRMNYNYVNGILSIVPWLHGLCLGAAALSGAAYMVKNTVSPGSMALNLCTCAGYMMGAALCIFLAAQYQKIPFGTCKNEGVK